MSINNTFGGKGSSRIKTLPLIYNFAVTSATTSSITVNINMRQQLAKSVSWSLSASLPTTYSDGCHSALRRLGYAGPSLNSVSGFGSVGTQSITLSGLYYESDYVLTFSVTTSAGTDYYSINASTLSPDDIILLGNPTGLNNNTYNADNTSSLGPLIMPKNVTSVTAIVIGGGGSGTAYGGGGGGGGCAYGNSLSLIAGQPVNYQVGGSGLYGAPPTSGGASFLVSSAFLQGGGGSFGQSGNNGTAGGGGGAGSPTSNGGNGGGVGTPNYVGGTGGTTSGTARTGGGIGGTGGAGSTTNVAVGAGTLGGGAGGGGGGGGWLGGQGGGGVGLYGQSSLDSNGNTLTAGGATAAGAAATYVNNGSSGGTSAQYNATTFEGGGLYGGGAPGNSQSGGRGAIRLCLNKPNSGIPTRTFPTTNVGIVPTNTFQYQF